MSIPMHMLWMLMLALPVLAQDGGTATGKVFWSDSEKSPSEETLYIPIKDSEKGIPNYLAMQRGFNYLGADGNKTWLEPWDVDRIEMEYRDRSYDFVSTNYSGKRLIMRLQSDGKLRVLEYRFTSRDTETYIVTEHVSRVLSFEGGDQGKNTKVYLMGFKRAMKEFFEDYPEMVQKVKKKEFTYRTVDNMVDYFNKTYGDK